MAVIMHNLGFYQCYKMRCGTLEVILICSWIAYSLQCQVQAGFQLVI